jgi:Transcription factor WhiB
MTPHRTPARPPSLPSPQRAPHLASGICARWPDPDVWHRTGSRDLALALCARCPVLAPCRAWASTAPATDAAVIGGTTPADRSALRRARQAALTAALEPAPAA